MKYVAVGTDVYEVTPNGQHWVMHKRFKTEGGAARYAARKNGQRK